MNKKGVSRLDPHIDFIRDRLEEGCSISEILDRLYMEKDIDVSYGCVSHFLKARGLRSLHVSGSQSNGLHAPRCSECEYGLLCKTMQNKTEHYVCTKMRIIVPKYYKTSPMECPERKVSVSVNT